MSFRLIRYRSQLCNDGPKCRRRVCFFAHTIDQLRVPSSKRISSGDAPSADLRVRPLPWRQAHCHSFRSSNALLPSEERLWLWSCGGENTA